jgi:sugar/nucleoside kinase (ribokinase family)
MSQPLWDVTAVGNAIVDVVAYTEEGFLEAQGLAKGRMTLIDAARAEALYAAMGPALECSGGSAANTLAGLASLGGSGAFIGKVRDDLLGRVFQHDIRAIGVRFDTPPASDGPPTARCLIFVTPDAQRTMQTYLGASTTLGPREIDEATIQNGALLYLEGYLYDLDSARQAMHHAARVAHDAGRKVALTLSDPGCVERHRSEFQRFVTEEVDLLFANEMEALALFRADSLEQAVRELSGCCELAVITRSAEGCWVLHGGRVIRVGAEPVAKVVDTTGAGDLYASGFLYGYCRGHDPETCARIGSLAAAEVISHYGARPETPLKALLKDGK